MLKGYLDRCLLIVTECLATPTKALPNGEVFSFTELTEFSFDDELSDPTHDFSANIPATPDVQLHQQAAPLPSSVRKKFMANEKEVI